MKRVEQKLQDLASRRGLGSLAQAILQSRERILDAVSEQQDPVAELRERSSHPHDGAVDIDEFGAEVDEIGVISVD